MSYRIAVSLALSFAATLTAFLAIPPPAEADDGTVYVVVPVPFIQPFCVWQDTMGTADLAAAALPSPLREAVGEFDVVAVCFGKQP